MKKRIWILCIFVFIYMQFLSAGVLAYPRKINLYKTQHFDILYPDESISVASYIADNAENFYARAQYYLETEVDLKIPVVVSPDSDTLSVSYSSYPYNRLLVFDAVASADQLGFENVFSSMLYREIYLAIAQAKMSPFNQLVHDTIGGDKYTPATLFNLPASMVDGYGYLIQSDYDYLKVQDGYFLQLLSEAKLEDKFPSWFQVFAKRDTYPGDVLSQAAGTAFSAFLIQSRGIEKYAELWDECGKLHPFFAAGILYKVYQTKISTLWKEFEESIPLPENLETLNAIELEAEKLFENSESNYNQLVYSEYGVIWYDDLRHEVESYDFNQEPLFPNLEKMQRTLFSAEGIEKLSVSKEGRYLSVSFIQSKKENTLHKNVTWIYDLKERIFLEDAYKLEEATIVTLADGTNAVAGISVENKYPELQVFTSRNFGSKTNEVIYKKSFDVNSIPVSLAYGGPGKVLFLLSENGSTFLVLLDISTGETKRFSIADIQNQPLKIKNLVYQNKKGQQTNQEIYTFQFSKADENSLLRTGSFILDEQIPDAVSLQNVDVAGGVNFPVLMEDKVVFASRKLFHDEFEILPLQSLELQPGRVVAVEGGTVAEEAALENLIEADQRYSLIRYWHRFSAMPFTPIKSISFDDGADSALGLGALVKLVPDPFMNNKLNVSAAWSFLNLNFEWMFNAPEDEQKLAEQANQTIAKDKTFAFYWENTSTPLDIKAGSLFRCNQIGEYDFEAMTGVSWTVPLGFTFNELEFKIHGEYKASTDYFDVNYSDIYSSKRGFPKFSDAYELVTGTASVDFKNIHQYGSSVFEQKGFAAGFEVYSLWDLYKYRNAKQSDPYVSQMFFGVHGSIALPQLIPLKPNKQGWILGLPLQASVEVAPKVGDILNTDVQVLLIGKEVQNGIPYVNLYFNRVGLKAGHEMNVKYDTKNISLPDFRRFSYTYDIFTNSKISNNIYLLLNLDFLFPIGPLSQKVIHSEFKTTYYPDTNGFTFNLNFKLNF